MLSHYLPVKRHLSVLATVNHHQTLTLLTQNLRYHQKSLQLHVHLVSACVSTNQLPVVGLYDLGTIKSLPPRRGMHTDNYSWHIAGRSRPATKVQLEMTLSLLYYDLSAIYIVDVHFHFTQHCFFCLRSPNFDLLPQKDSLPLNTLYRSHVNYKCIIGCQCQQETGQFYRQWTVEDSQNWMFTEGLRRQTIKYISLDSMQVCWPWNTGFYATLKYQPMSLKKLCMVFLAPTQHRWRQ